VFTAVVGHSVLLQLWVLLLQVLVQDTSTVPDSEVL
jgi:hypothetical protein